MNSEIEQRIVAMYFDNKDFEKNAQQTIGTLGQLKEGLNLEDSVKGFDELDKAGKKLNLNQARTSVTNLKNALGGLGSVVQKAFNIGTAPLHALDNFFGTFRSYVGKFVGFDLASKFVNSLESALQQLTVAPIQAGWQMYQANVDSTKTIMSGTMKSYKEEMSKVNADWTYDEAEHMEFVKKHLRDLSDYAAKTVFSLQDMTSNVGKFTNQNIDLETSVTAMKGIANMTAKAGQGAQQASMAMYNFSQALGVGKMTTLDWKSIENANIATTELKDMFIMAAAAAGKLRKETEKIDGKEVDKFFITVDKNGKKLARKNWLEVSAENFRETLQQGWLDKDTMLHVMQLYSNEGFDLDTLAAWGFDIKDTELMEQLKAVGEEAMLAATQVRTFSKMWDALTESVQSSWADSMELIFGDMTEATTFWTTINDKIGGVMDKIGEERNNILREWRGETWDENTKAWIRLDNSIDGREDLINGIYGLIDAAQSLGGAFSSAWASVFGNLTGKKLQEITKGFREFIDGFKGWLGDMDDSNSRLSKIRSGLTGVFNVLKIVWEVVKNMFGMLKAVAMPLIDPILKLFDKFGKWLNFDKVKNLGDMLGVLRDRFTQLWNKISGLGWGGVLGKIGEWFGNLWSQIREGIHNFMEENGLGGIFDWFVGLGDSIKAGFDSVVEWWNSDENKISGFFQGIWDEIAGIFNGRSGSDFIPKGYNGNVDLLTRPKVKIEAVTEAGWVDEEGNPLGGDYATVLTNTFSIGDKKKGFDFSYNENAVINITPILADGKVLSPEALETYVEEITAEAKRTGKTVKEVDAGRYGLMLSYDVVPDDMSLDEAYEKAGEWAEKLHDLQEQWDETGRTEEEAPIVKFFNDTWSSLRDTFTDIMSWPIWGQIGTFFSGVWDTISGIFEPKLTGVYYDGTGRHAEYGNSSFVQFFLDTWEGIKNAFEEVQSWGIWNTIGTFFSGVWDTLSGIFKPVDRYDDRGFMLNEKGNSPFVQFFVDTWEGIKNAFEEVKSWGIWNSIGSFFSGVWNTISSIFTPKEIGRYNGSMLEYKVEDAPIVKFFKDTWETMKKAFEEVKKWDGWKTIGDFFSGVWESVSGIFTPKEVGRYNGSMLEYTVEDAPIVKFFKDTWETIKSVFGEIAAWWNDPDNAVSGFFKNIWSSITGLFNGTGEVAEEVGDASEKINNAAEQASSSGKDDGGKTGKSLGILGDIIDKVKSFITEVIDKIAGVEIPPQVETFFKGLGDFLLGVANAIGVVMGSVGRFLGGGEATAGDKWGVALGVLGVVLTQVFDFIHTKDLGKVKTQTFAQQFMSFALGLLAMATAVALLSALEPGKMWPAIGALVVLGAVISAILIFAEKLKKTTSSSVPETTMTERLLGKLISTLKTVGSIAVIMALLPPVLEAFGKAKSLAPELNGLDVIGLMTSIVIAVVGISAGLAVLDKITASKGIDPLAAIKSAAALIGFIGVIALGLLGAGGLLELVDGIVDAIGGKDVDTVGALKGALEKVSALVEGIGGVLYGFVKGLFNIKTDKEKQDAAMENLNALADVSDKFDLETTSGILRIMAMVTNLTKLTEKINIDKMDDFEKAMEQMARGILKFSWIFEGIDDIEGIGTIDSDRYKNFQGAIDLVQQTLNSFSGLKGFGDMGSQSTLMHGVNDFIEFANNDTSVQAFVDGVNKVLKSFAGLDDGSNVNFDGVKIIQTMYDAIQMAFADPSANLPEFDATPIVDSIIKAIGLGESAIALAVHSMVQEGLKASESGETGGYTFDATQALQFLQNPGALTSVTGTIDQYKEMLYGKGGTAENPSKDSIMGLFTGLSGEIDGIEIPSIADKFKDSISMKDPETGEDVDIVGMMKGTIDSLQTEINNLPPFEIKIVPTYDFSNLKAETLQSMLRDYPIKVPFGQNGYNIPDMIRVDFSGIGAELDLSGIKYRLDNINASVGANGVNTVAAIDRMAAHIDRISAAIAQMQPIVDMSGMIPVIDRELGKRAAASSATGVSSMLSNPYQIVQRTKPVAMTE